MPCDLQPLPRLAQIEEEIEKNWAAYKDVMNSLQQFSEVKIKATLRVGVLLEEVRTKELHVPQYTTWQNYVTKRWGITRQYANRLRAYVDVMSDLAEMETIVSTPTLTEGQANEMSRLSPDERRKVYAKATEGGDKPTAARIKEARELIKRQMESRLTESKPIEEKDLDGQLEEMERSEAVIDLAYDEQEQVRLDLRLQDLDKQVRKAIRTAEEIGERAADVLAALNLAAERLGPLLAA